MARPELRILGVDTALRCTGVAVIEARGSALRCVYGGVVRTAARTPLPEALARLQDDIARLIEAHRPDAVAVEGVFFHRNARTAFVLGQARGVVLAACAVRGIPVFEYAPRAVKQAVTGHGGAEKEQVARMITALLGLRETPSPDASDALALAVCHAQHATSRRLGLGRPL